MQSLRLISTGAALPQKAWSNDALIAAKGLESSHEWIFSRTGIAQRYLAGEGEDTFTLARDAALQALARAGVKAEDVGVIVVGTCTPARTLPSTAALVHGALGCGWQCTAVDVNAVCSGFMYALQTAAALLKESPSRYALVIGADCLSKILDWTDRTTCVLFGDGAGAILLEKTETAAPEGLLAIATGAHGQGANLLTSTGGTGSTGTVGHITMNGREVYKHAVRYMGTPPQVLQNAGLTVADVAWWVPHQANARILTAAADALGVPYSKVMMTVETHANTSAATIPLALDVLNGTGKLQRGHYVVFQSFGAGLTWGEALVKW